MKLRMLFGLTLERIDYYLNGELPSAAICYGVYDDDKIIAFMGVLHQPHGINKKIKRVFLFVVFSDYQGVGIATRFLKMSEGKERYKVLSELLGHSSINITLNIYCHITDELKQNVMREFNDMNILNGFSA